MVASRGVRQITVDKVSMLASGLPSDPRTFSGYARNLFLTMQSRGLIRREYNIGPRRWLDVLYGLSVVSHEQLRWWREINQRWIWTQRGADLLSRRLDQRIRRLRDYGAFLQIGTLVWIAPEHGRHYMLTDMTIPQACRAGRFAVSRLTKAERNEAEEMQRRRLAEASHVFALCQWTADSLMSDCGVPPDRISVVYAGSNLRIPPGLREPKQPREILFVGMDWTRKGGALLLEAFERVRQKLPDATLTIVGCDPGCSAPGVRVEGYLSRRSPAEFERLARCYLRASCFCLPSSFDPFPNAIIEAATAGLPTVAIDNGSRREVVIDGVTGRLAGSPDAAELAEVLTNLLLDTEHLASMGLRACSHAEEFFTWDRVVQRIMGRIRQDSNW